MIGVNRKWGPTENWWKNALPLIVVVSVAGSGVREGAKAIRTSSKLEGVLREQTLC